MRSKLGTVCMILGAALLVAALSLFLWNQYENYKAGQSTDEILPALIEQMETEGDNTIDGYTYIGYVTIPTLGLDLPVMDSWSYEQLVIAPCRYYGSVQTNDLVIAAHNYAKHFGHIKDLSPGDAVYFTDTEGVTTAYEVIEIDTLNPTDVEEMTSSGYDLTLFTCTYGGKSRVTVRCDRA